MIEWHRLIGLTITDFFSDTSYKVELEKDMSVQQQFLDVVIIEKHSGVLHECPDGFDDLAKHNLLTYKSHRQVLDEWAVHELVGHYVAYRKLISPRESLLPAGDFRLYAVSTRFPRHLSGAMAFESVAEGVYDIRWGNLRVRVIVPRRTAKKPENAIWQLFSAVPEKVRYGAETYRWRKHEAGGIINDLFKKYKTEGVVMPYTFEDYQRDYVLEHIHKLPPEDILERFFEDDLLKRFSAEDLLKRLSTEDFLKRFSAEDLLKRFFEEDLLKRFSAEDLLKRLSTEDFLKRFSAEDLLKRLSRKDIAPALRKQLSGLTPEEKKAFVEELLKSDK